MPYSHLMHPLQICTILRGKGSRKHTITTNSVSTHNNSITLCPNSEHPCPRKLTRHPCCMPTTCSNFPYNKQCVGEQATDHAMIVHHQWQRCERIDMQKRTGNGGHLTIKCHGILENREWDFVSSFIKEWCIDNPTGFQSYLCKPTNQNSLKTEKIA